MMTQETHDKITFADDDVTLEMDAVTLGELEHGEELGLGGASDTVIGELGHDGGVGAAPAIHQLHRGVHVGEAEAPPDRHPEAAVIVRDVGPAKCQVSVLSPVPSFLPHLSIQSWTNS